MTNRTIRLSSGGGRGASQPRARGGVGGLGPRGAGAGPRICTLGGKKKKSRKESIDSQCSTTSLGQRKEDVDLLDGMLEKLTCESFLGERKKDILFGPPPEYVRSLELGGSSSSSTGNDAGEGGVLGALSAFTGKKAGGLWPSSDGPLVGGKKARKLEEKRRREEEERKKKAEEAKKDGGKKPEQQKEQQKIHHNLPFFIPLGTEGEIRRVILMAKEIFMDQPQFLELEPPINICGDIHGQFADLLHLFEIGGKPGIQSNYLFLGDYVDRGQMSLESMMLLLILKIKFPENIFLLRGNHEASLITQMYGFMDECKRKYSIGLWKSFVNLFQYLPVAAVIGEKIFCCHGGIGPDLLDNEEWERAGVKMEMKHDKKVALAEEERIGKEMEEEIRSCVRGESVALGSLGESMVGGSRRGSVESNKSGGVEGSSSPSAKRRKVDDALDNGKDGKSDINAVPSSAFSPVLRAVTPGSSSSSSPSPELLALTEENLSQLDPTTGANKKGAKFWNGKALGHRHPLIHPPNPNASAMEILQHQSRVNQRIEPPKLAVKDSKCNKKYMTLLRMKMAKFLPQRPVEVPDFGLMCDLLWADPNLGTPFWGESERGVSYCFGAQVLDNFLAKYNLDLVVRAHQCVEDGYQFFNKKKLVTIFSAPNYCADLDNAGAMLVVDENLKCRFKVWKSQNFIPGTQIMLNKGIDRWNGVMAKKAVDDSRRAIEERKEREEEEERKKEGKKDNEGKKDENEVGSSLFAKSPVLEAGAKVFGKSDLTTTSSRKDTTSEDSPQRDITDPITPCQNAALMEETQRKLAGLNSNAPGPQLQAHLRRKHISDCQLNLAINGPVVHKPRSRAGSECSMVSVVSRASGGGPTGDSSSAVSTHNIGTFSSCGSLVGSIAGSLAGSVCGSVAGSVAGSICGRSRSGSMMSSRSEGEGKTGKGIKGEKEGKKRKGSRGEKEESGENSKKEISGKDEAHSGKKSKKSKKSNKIAAGKLGA